MTTILIKKKDTAGAPAPGDLTNAAGGAEIAVNTATKRVYSKDSSNAIIEMGTFPSSMAVQGALSATGATTLNGAVTLGDAAADNITVNGTITSNLIFTDNTYDIGAAAATRPRNIFLSGSGTVDSAMNIGRAGFARGFAAFYPSNATTWFYIRNDNAGGLEFSNGVSPGSAVSLTLAPAAGTSTLSTSLVFSPDNTYDIGANGATRPRSLFAGSGVNAPLGNFPSGLRVSNAFDSGGASSWWEIGTWAPSNFSNEIELVVYGGASFSAASPIANKTTILIRVNNAGGWNGVWRSEGIQGSSGVAAVSVNSSTGKVYIQIGAFFQKQLSVIAADTDAWTLGWVNTGSNTLPAGTTLLSNIYQFSDSLITVDAGNRSVSIGTSTINAARKLYVYGGDTLVERAGVNVGVGVYSSGGSGRTYYVVSDINGRWQLYDEPANANRITVNGTGEVGVNSTPKTWQGGISVLQLGGQGSWSYGGGTNMVLGNNRYFNGGDKFIASGNYATLLEMSNGTFGLGHSSVSGTADAAITWNYSLTTNQSGQVLLPGGTASIPTPSAGYVLDVRGSVIAQRASGNTSLVAQASNANAAMNAIVGFGVEFNTDSSFTSYAWAKGGVRKMFLIANDSGTSSLGLGNVSNPQAYSVNGSRCSIVTQQPIVSNDSVVSRMQTRLYSIADTGGSTQWVRLGNFSTSQQGCILKVRYYGHVGFNANPGQNGIVEILFVTGNSSSFVSGSTGPFYANGQTFRLGPAQVILTCRIVQVTLDLYEVWGFIPNFSLSCGYEVSYSDGSAWTHIGTTGTPTGNFIDLTQSVITYT